MRIVVLCSTYNDHPEEQTMGPVLRGLAHAYARLGYPVVMAWKRLPDELGLETPSASDHVPVFRFGGRSPQSSFRRALATFIHVFRFVNRGDIIHVQTITHYDAPALACLLACRAKGAKMGVTFRFCDWSEERTPFWEIAIRNFLFMRSLWVVTTSRYMLQQLQRQMPFLSKRMKVIGNGLDWDEIRAVSSIKGAPFQGGRPYVFCLARLAPYKGIDILLWAWAAAERAAPPVDLVFGGPDFSSGHYQRLAQMLGISHRVRFLGNLDRPQALSYVKDSLFFVCPSRHEPHGKAILEAMALGKAVISSATGPADYIDHDIDGLLVPPGSIQELRQAILGLLSDQGLRVRLGQAAQRKARNYSWDQTAALYLELARFSQ